MKTSRLYLDHAASSPMQASVVEAMQSYLQSAGPGHPSSVHTEGRSQEATVSEARARVAGLLNAHPAEIILTGSGTEAANLAIKGAAWAARRAGRPARVVLSSVEHECVRESCASLSQHGFDVLTLPVSPHAGIDERMLEQALEQGTALVSIQLANHETGLVFPIQALARRARAAGALFHCDAAMGVGRVPVSVDTLGVDLLTISGHKFGGPPGAGALYLRKGTALEAQMHGGPQERRRRGGGLSVVNLVGLGVAATMLDPSPEAREAFSQRTERLWHRLRLEIPALERLGVPDAPDSRLPGLLCLAFSGVEGESLLMNLDLAGIAASSGAPCSSGSLTPSPVLLALGYEERVARSAVRFSFGPETTDAALERLGEVLPPLVARLQRLTKTARLHP